VNRKNTRTKTVRSMPPIFGPCPLWPNRCIDEDATWYGGRPHCVRWWHSSAPSPPKKGYSPQFSAHVCCSQTVAHLSYCWALVKYRVVRKWRFLVNGRIQPLAKDSSVFTMRYDIGLLYLRAPNSWRITSWICLTDTKEKQKRIMKKNKNRDGQKKRCSHEVRGVSLSHYGCWVGRSIAFRSWPAVWLIIKSLSARCWLLTIPPCQNSQSVDPTCLLFELLKTVSLVSWSSLWGKALAEMAFCATTYAQRL